MVSRKALEQAFLDTRYRVLSEAGAIDIRIGQCQPVLDALLRQARCKRWAVFSPCNPGARLLDERENTERMIRLKALLVSEGMEFMDALGVPAEGEDWPAEPSVLVLDPRPQQLTRWAEEFVQLAWVEGGLGQVATLVWSPGN